jgi:hypothetical protein
MEREGSLPCSENAELYRGHKNICFCLERITSSTPLVDFQVMVSCVVVFSDELSHSFCAVKPR